MSRNSIEQAASEAQKALSAIAPGAFCIPQDWDNRVDCLITQPDGSVVGEMIELSELDAARLQATGKRLRMRSQGREVPLVDEIQPPTRIVPDDQ
jgi:hypothetical protein